MSRQLVAVLILLGLPMLVCGETMYVTDNLRLGLHKLEDTSDRPFRTLDSGQQLEIIERRRNFAKVRVPDGAEGFVKFAYLVADKPAKLIVEETLASRDALAKELAQARETFADPAARIAVLEADLQESRAAADEAFSRNQELGAENEAYKKRSAMYKYNLPWQWVLGASFTCLLVGFLGAFWFIDSRSRKRHGGFRIY